MKMSEYTDEFIEGQIRYFEKINQSHWAIDYSNERFKRFNEGKWTLSCPYLERHKKFVEQWRKRNDR